LSLVTANNEAQLLRKREHDVEVRHGQKQIALLLDPRVRARTSALGTRSIVARVKLDVTRSTGLTFGEVSTKGGCSTASDISERAGVAGQHGAAESPEVLRPVSTHHVDHAAGGHGATS